MTAHFQKFFRTYGFEVSLFTINDISVISLVKESYRGKIDKKKAYRGVLYRWWQR